jgi:lipoprotein-anchoring transpeptidase ErfK/SrfK
MRDRNRGATRARTGTVAVASLLALALTALPLGASALTVVAPASVTGPADVTVTLEAGEGPGTVTLFDGSAAVGTTLTIDGVADFHGITFPAGGHSLHAVLAGSGDGGRWTSPVVPLYAWGTPGPPHLTSPAKTRVISPVAIKAQAGASTATLTLEVDGVAVRSVACQPGAAVSLGSSRLAKGASTIAVVATSLTGETSSVSKTVIRYEWPYSTCIVVDKSDYRLYWVRGQQLIAAYRIAHGRHNWTPVATWKILAKYKTDPRSVYGPRKMRMFRRVGSLGHYRYVYTRYAIHGTNRPSSIGHQASHGCIRMYSSDVLTLWPQVRIGTYVVTRP